jgi:hypothetical protein
VKQLIVGVFAVAVFGAAALVAAFYATIPAAPSAPVEPAPAMAGTTQGPVATATAASAASSTGVDPSTPALPVAPAPPAPLPTAAQATLPPAGGNDGLGASPASLASRQGARLQRQAGLIARLRHNRAPPREEHATGGTACPRGDCSASSDHLPRERNRSPSPSEQ